MGARHNDPIGVRLSEAEKLSLRDASAGVKALLALLADARRSASPNDQARIIAHICRIAMLTGLSAEQRTALGLSWEFVITLAQEAARIEYSKDNVGRLMTICKIIGDEDGFERYRDEFRTFDPPI